MSYQQNFATAEGNVVRLSDKIAYINHDIEDAIRAGILKPSDLPENAVKILGSTKSKRITTLVSSIIENGADEIRMTNKIKAAHGISLEASCLNLYTQIRPQKKKKKKQRYLLNSFMNTSKKIRKKCRKNTFRFAENLTVTELFAIIFPE